MEAVSQLPADDAVSYFRLATMCALLIALPWGLLTYLWQIKIPLVGRLVVITGCDSGLGRAAALALHRRGAHVLAGCLTSQGLSDLKDLATNTIPMVGEELATCASRFRVQLLDVTSDKSVGAFVATADKWAGPHGVHALINNAGVMQGELVDFTSLDTYRRVMDVNWLGTVRVTKAFLPAIKRYARLRTTSRHPHPRIINTSAFSLSAYCSSKFAVEAFTDSLRQEMFGFGVRVSLIEPGAMKTSMANELAKTRLQNPEGAPGNAIDEYGPSYRTALRRSVHVMDMVSRDVSTVVPDIESAVCAISPNHRYVGGKDAWLFGVLPRFLPSALCDHLALAILKSPRPSHHAPL